MGCCQSFFGSGGVPHGSEGFPIVEIRQDSDDSSDEILKAKGGKDVMPLLEGPTLLAFKNLKLSGSSSSVDIEMDQIGELLKSTDKDEASSDDGTFKDVNT